MKVIEGIHSLRKLGQRNLGVAIGNFDGFHRGHQNMLKEVLNFCREKNVVLMVMTFVPHPHIVLKEEKNFLINGYQSRRDFMREFGLELLCEIKFTRQFSQLSPEEFLNEHILKEKSIRHLFIGHDFSFGRGKKGDRNFVEKFCHGNDISIKVLDEFKKEDEAISSSHIRNLLKRGNITKANNLLGRCFFLEGTVVHGRARGKSIGIPTANLAIEDRLIVPRSGVYGTKVACQRKEYLSLTNIGFNPTFKNSHEITIETHILDFNENIYDEKIRVSFMDKIREEKIFPSSDELKRQIDCDISERRSMRT